ncbi:MAG TPA: DUF2934 domain-containing protein [Terriglobales bacterium]|jgi:hypothetical protein|nr:DUF2934 domain-containing protein [Terriglobales bacterium]
MATPKRARATSSETTRRKKTAEPKTETAVQTPEVTDIEEAIRVRAYQLWERRGHPYGSAMDDWLKAETEIVVFNGARTA